MTTTPVADKEAVTDRPPSPSAPAGRSTVSRWVRRIAAAIAVSVLLVVAAAGAAALASGRWMATPVLSGSMRPGFPVGGLVICQRVPVTSLAVRDVIVFRDPNNPSEQVVHRIIHLEAGSTPGQLLIKTQGDANRDSDPWTLTIRGSTAYRARWSVPLAGYVALAFQNHRGYILLGVGVLALLAGASAFRSDLVAWAKRRDRRAPSPSADA